MDFLHRAELLVAMLLAMVTLTAVSRRLLVPYPIVLVLGGLVLGLLPGLPSLQLDPGFVFLLFLPRSSGPPPTVPRCGNSRSTSARSSSSPSAW